VYITDIRVSRDGFGSLTFRCDGKKYRSRGIVMTNSPEMEAFKEIDSTGQWDLIIDKENFINNDGTILEVPSGYTAVSIAVAPGTSVDLEDFWKMYNKILASKSVP